MSTDKSYIAFVSAKGSPGVTTTVLALAAKAAASGTWTLVVEADPFGGDIAVPAGLASQPGLRTLGADLLRSGDPGRVLKHAQHLADRLDVVVGFDSVVQAVALGGAWHAIAGALGELSGPKTLVDLGRLMPLERTSMEIVRKAASTIIVSGTDAAHVRHVSVWADHLRRTGVEPGLVVIDDGHYSAVEVAAAARVRLLGALPKTRVAGIAERDFSVVNGKGDYARALGDLAKELDLLSEPVPVASGSSGRRTA